MSIPNLTRPRVEFHSDASATRAAAFKVELPFIKRAILTGSGPFKDCYVRLAMRQASPLFVRGLMVEAIDGSRICLMGSDLHGGSRWLTERVAQLTSDQGFHAGNIFLSASHNHSGPGGLYGSPYYDGFAAPTAFFRSIRGGGRLGFNRELMEWIALAIAHEIKSAVWERASIAAGVSHAPPSLAVNRSPDAFLMNFGLEKDGRESATNAALIQLNKRFPVDPTFSIERAAVDPRVSSVVAFTDNDAAQVIGAFATYGAHNFVLDRKHDIQSPDYFGEAAGKVESVLAAEQKRPPVIALVAGSVGDSDPLPPSFKTLREFRETRADSTEEAALKMVDCHAEAIKLPLLESISAARAVGRHELLSITAGFLEEAIAGATVPSGSVAQLPCIGTPTLAGSELGLGNAFFFHEGATIYASAEGHLPKDTLNLLLAIPNGQLRRQPKTLPVRLLRLNFAHCPAVSLLGIPGEPTLWSAITLSELARRDESECAFVVAVTGEYSGYLTTKDEYQAQQYEGSSTIWGPLTHEWLKAQISKLRDSKTWPAPTGDAHFTGDLETWHPNIYTVEGRPIGFWSPDCLRVEQVIKEHAQKEAPGVP